MLRKFDQLPKKKFMFLSNMGGVHNICNDNVMSFVSYCLFVTNLRMYMLSYMYELLDTNICAIANENRYCKTQCS